MLTGALGVYIYENRSTSAQLAASNCSDPGNISSHVYNPDRLQLVNTCIVASGTVAALRPEDDGDYHVILHLDSAYSNLTNAANDQYQNGDLVVEIICALHPITQQDAVSACQNYSNHITVPDVGQHIIVSGPYLFDNDHHGWAEIHPVYSLTVS
jgi:hypothetical protein